MVKDQERAEVVFGGSKKASSKAFFGVRKGFELYSSRVDYLWLQKLTFVRTYM